jgi:hypothetical protein
MTSPLKPYINGRLLVPSQGTVSLVGGRWEEAAGDSHLVKLFVKRAQYSGVSSGSKRLPLESQLDGNMLPGGSGDQFYYRGYALEWAEVPADWDLELSDETGLVFAQVMTQYTWLSTGTECSLRIGDDPIMEAAKIQRSSGVFGGTGIDEIVYREIGGVQIQITGAELQN